MIPVWKYEHKKKPLLPATLFYRRIFNSFLLAVVIILFSLSIGIIGYMKLADMDFVDAVLNASMILGGMGPVDVLTSDGAKYFASFYSLFIALRALERNHIRIL